MEIGEMKRLNSGPAADEQQERALRGHFFTENRLRLEGLLDAPVLRPDSRTDGRTPEQPPWYPVGPPPPGGGLWPPT